MLSASYNASHATYSLLVGKHTVELKFGHTHQQQTNNIEDHLKAFKVGLIDVLINDLIKCFDKHFVKWVK